MTISIHIYTVLYIYTVINKYMSRSAPSLPPSPRKLTVSLLFLSSFCTGKLIMMEQKSQLNNKILQSRGGRVTEAGEEGITDAK